MTAEGIASLPTGLQRMWVLYVDDDARVCGWVRRFLTNTGMICHVATSHDESVAFLEDARRLDLAIVEYEMADGDVRSLVERLRAIRPGLPILGSAVTDRRAGCPQVGLDGFLQMPWQLEDLIERCRSLPLGRDSHRSDARPHAYTFAGLSETGRSS
jgi:DNA-binding response OmpR family regulator